MKLTFSNSFKICIFATLIIFLSAQEQRQQFNPERNTRLTFDFNFTNPNTMIAVVLTSAETRTNNTFFYGLDVLSLRIPRILSCVKVVPDSNTQGTALIPPLKLAEVETNVSAHYFRITNDSINPMNNFIISASETTKTADFPRQGEVFEQLQVSPSDVPDLTGYQTVVYSTLVHHNSTVNATCQYSIQYSGIVRSIFWNDDPKGQWGTVTDDILAEHSFTSGPIEIKTDQLHYLTIIGYRLNLITFDIINCQNERITPPAPVPVNITYLLAGTRITAPKNITYNRQTSTCQAGAARCEDFSDSYFCYFNFYRANSRCRAFCPLDQTTVTAYGDCTSFRFEDIRRGYKTQVERTVSTNTEFEFYVDLPEKSQVLTIFWPSRSILTTPTALWFAQGAYLMSGALLTTDVVDATGVVSYSVPIRLLYDNSLGQDGTQTVIYTHYEMITDPNKTIMAVSYNEKPTTDAQKQNPRSFSYFPHNEKLQVNPETFVYFTTFVECFQPCTISIFGTGYIEGFEDMRTFLFGMDFGTQPWTYTLPNTFTGLHWFTFTTTGSSHFGFNVVSREFNIFSHGFPLTRQNITISQRPNSVSDSTSNNCANGENGACFSCNEGFFLNPTTKTCDSTCPAGFLTYAPGRQCYSSSCKEHTVQIEGNQCMPQCDVEGKYYIQGLGCSGECFKGCPVCSNNTGICVSCAYKDPVSFVSQCSHCPPGTSFNTNTNGCTTTASLVIMGNSQVLQCSDMILTASMDPVEELYLTPVNFTWTVSSSSADFELTQLQQFLLNQHSKELIVPSRFLQVGVEYVFTVQYLNVYDNAIRASFTTSVVNGGLPPISIDGGSNQVFYHYEENILKLRVTYAEGCFNISQPLQVTWSQTSGPSVNLNGESSLMSSPFWLSFPKCTFTPGNTYEFQAQVSTPGSQAQAITTISKFRVPPVNFTVEIGNGNRELPSNADISLQAIINYKAGQCAQNEETPITYTWTCEKKNIGEGDISYDSCTDPRQLFNMPSNSPSFMIPSSYFNQDNTLRIGIIARKGNDVTSSSVELNITSPDTLMLSLDCQNCNLYSYPQELIFVGDVPSSTLSGQLANYQWSVNPILPSNAYQYTFKVTKNNSLIGQDFMTVNLQAEYNARQAKSYLKVPVDPAPENGRLSISPETGYSLSTYYHIAAEGWQDDDAPLSYALYYTFGDGHEHRLSDQQRFPYFYTMLPGNASNSQITLRMVISDSLGAQVSETITTTARSRGDNIMDALRTFRNTFGSITRNGDSSVFNGDSFEVLKTLSFIAIEMASFENLNISFSQGSLSTEEKTQIIAFKMAMINNLRMIHSTIPNVDTDEIFFQTLRAASYNTVFNAPESINLMLDTMNSNLRREQFLTTSELRNTGAILSNVIANFGAADYSESNTEVIRDFTHAWLNRMSSSALNNKIPGEKPVNLVTNNLDAYIVQTTGCSLVRSSIQTSPNSPILTFNVIGDMQNDPSLDCDHAYRVVYYAFNPQYSSDQNATTLINAEKSLLAMQIFDLDGNPVNLPVTYILTNTDKCPIDCSIREDLSCRCTRGSTFDLEKVLNTLFGLDGKKEYDVWFTVPFYATVGSATWFLLTLIIVSCIIPNYCKLAKLKALTHKSSFKAFSTSYWITHKLFSIYAYKDEELPKARRAFLYVLRIQLFTAFTCILTFFESYKDIVDIIKELIIYVALVPFVTIYIIHAILELLLRNYNTNQATLMRESDGGQSQEGIYKVLSVSKKPRNTKFKFFLGTFLTLALLAGALAFTWIIALQPTTEEERNTWAVTLILCIAIDIIVSPFVLLIFHYINALMWSSSCIQGSRSMRKFFGLLAGKELLEVRKEMSNAKRVSPKLAEIQRLGSQPSSVSLLHKTPKTEYYGNVAHAKHEEFSETEVGRANLNKGEIHLDHGERLLSNNYLEKSDLSLLDMDAFARQQFIESLLDHDLPPMLKGISHTKSTEPLLNNDQTLRNSLLPGLGRFDSQNQGNMLKQFNDTMLLQDIEEEKEGESGVLRKSGFMPGASQMRRGSDGLISFRNNQLGKSNNMGQGGFEASREPSVRTSIRNQDPFGLGIDIRSSKGSRPETGKVGENIESNPLLKSLNGIDPRFVDEKNYNMNVLDLLYADGNANELVPNGVNGNLAQSGYPQIPKIANSQNERHAEEVQQSPNPYYQSLASIIPEMTHNQLQGILTSIKEEDPKHYNKNLAEVIQNLTPQQLQNVLKTSKKLDPILQKDLVDAMNTNTEQQNKRTINQIKGMNPQQLQEFFNSRKEQGAEQYQNELAGLVQNMSSQQLQEIITASKSIDPVFQKDLANALNVPNQKNKKLADQAINMSSEQLENFLKDMKAQNVEQYQKNLVSMVQALTPSQRQEIVDNSKTIDPVLQKDLINAMNSPTEQDYKNIAAKVQIMTPQQLQGFMGKLKDQGEESFTKNLSNIVQAMTPQQIKEVITTSRAIDSTYHKDLLNTIKSSEKQNATLAANASQMNPQQLESFMNSLKLQGAEQYQNKLANIVQVMNPHQLQEIVKASKSMSPANQKDVLTAVMNTQDHYTKLANQAQTSNPRQFQEFMNDLKGENPEQYEKNLGNVMHSMTPQQLEETMRNISSMEPAHQREILNAMKGTQQFFKNLASNAYNMNPQQLQDLMSSLKAQGEEEYDKNLAGMLLNMTPQQLQTIVSTSKRMDPEFQRDFVNALKGAEKYHQDISSLPQSMHLSQLQARERLSQAKFQQLEENQQSMLASKVQGNNQHGKFLGGFVQDMTPQQLQGFMTSLKVQGPEQYSKNLTSVVQGMSSQQVHRMLNNLKAQGPEEYHRNLANILPCMNPQQLRDFMVMDYKENGSEQVYKNFSKAMKMMTPVELQRFMANLRTVAPQNYNRNLGEILQRMTPQEVQEVLVTSKTADPICHRDLMNVINAIDSPQQYYKNIANMIQDMSSQQLQGFMTGLKGQGIQNYNKTLACMMLNMTPAQLKNLITTAKGMDPIYYNDIVNALRNSEQYYKEVAQGNKTRGLSAMSHNAIPNSSKIFAAQRESSKVVNEGRQTQPEFHKEPDGGLYVCANCSKIELSTSMDHGLKSGPFHNRSDSEPVLKGLEPQLVKESVTRMKNDQPVKSSGVDASTFVNDKQLKESSKLFKDRKPLKQKVKPRRDSQDSNEYEDDFSSSHESDSKEEDREKDPKLSKRKERLKRISPMMSKKDSIIIIPQTASEEIKKSTSKVETTPKNQLLTNSKISEPNKEIQVEPEALKQSLDNLAQSQPKYVSRTSLASKVLNASLSNKKDSLNQTQGTIEKKDISIQKDEDTAPKNTPVISPKNNTKTKLENSPKKLEHKNSVTIEIQTEKYPGKDESWHAIDIASKQPEKRESIEIIPQTNIFKKVSLPEMNNAPSNESIINNSDAILNENLHNESKFMKRIVKKSSKKLANSHTRTIEIQTETKGGLAQKEETKENMKQNKPLNDVRNPLESPIEGRVDVDGGRASFSRTLSYQGSAWLAKNEEGQAFKNGKLSDTLDLIDTSKQMKPTRPVDPNPLNTRNLSRSRIDNYRLGAEESLNRDIITNLKETEQSRLGRSMRKSRMDLGLSLGRISSADSRQDFEVKLGKQASNISRNGCHHHEAN